MKKILSLFILGLLFAFNCTTSMSLVGFFDGGESKIMMMDHSNMGSSGQMDCCEDGEEESEKISHECCISPVGDINVSSSGGDQAKKKLLSDGDNDINAQGLCKSLVIEQNCISKITAPPEYIGEFIVVKSTYPELVGVIKNNC